MTMTGTEHEVRDGEQTVRFVGDLLGEADTNFPGRRRWHEVRLYRTVAGDYVIEKVGRSTVPGEVDRSTTKVSQTPHGAIECLYSRDADGVLYMTQAAKEALSKAATLDEDLARAFAVRDLTPDH